MKKRIFLLVLVTVLIFTFGCTNAANAAGGVITDLKGNEVKLPDKVERIISLAPNITETICELEKSDLIAGVDVNSNYPEEVTSLPKVGNFNDPDVEKIVSLKPDIIFAGSVIQDNAVETLKNMGFCVVVAEPKDLGEIYLSIELIGKALNCQNKAEKLTENIKNEIESVKQEMSKLKEHPKTYFALSYGELGNWTCGKYGFINELIEIAGGENIVKEEMSYFEIPLEQIVVLDPEIILITDDVGNVQDLSAQNGYSETQAVKTNNVYELNADLISRPGPRILETINMLKNIFDGYGK